MGEIDEMRAIIEASIMADGRDGAKARALDALYGLRARAEAAEQRAAAADAERDEARRLLGECEVALASVRTMHKGERANRLAAEQRAEAAEQHAAAAEAEVARLRAAWADAVAEVAAMGTEPDLGGLALTPRRSPATMKALREVAQMLAEAQPAEVPNA